MNIKTICILSVSAMKKEVNKHSILKHRLILLLISKQNVLIGIGTLHCNENLCATICNAVKKYDEDDSLLGMALCSLVGDGRFRCAYCCVYQRSLVMEAVHTSETSVYFYVTTRRHISESFRLLRENMNFH
jgi:hypothetical protein